MQNHDESLLLQCHKISQEQIKLLVILVDLAFNALLGIWPSSGQTVRSKEVAGFTNTKPVTKAEIIRNTVFCLCLSLAIRLCLPQSQLGFSPWHAQLAGLR